MNFEYTSEQIYSSPLHGARVCGGGDCAACMEWDENQIFPLDAIKKGGELGLPRRHFSGRLGRRGARLHRLLHHHRGACARRSVSGSYRRGPQFSLHEPYFPLPGIRSRSGRYIPKLATGEWIGCWSLTEPEAGSDAAGTRSTAVWQDERLGTKRRQDVHDECAVRGRLCRDVRHGPRRRRSTAFRRSLSTKTRPVSASAKKENKLGMRASATGEVLFRIAGLPARSFLASRARVLSTACAFSTADGFRSRPFGGHRTGRVRRRFKYSKQRKQFGRSDLRIPGHPAQTRGYGDQHRSGASTDLSCRRDERCRQAGHERVRDGEAVLVRNGRQSLR